MQTHMDTCNHTVTIETAIKLIIFWYQADLDVDAYADLDTDAESYPGVDVHTHAHSYN